MIWTMLSGLAPYSTIRSKVASGGMPLKYSTAAVTPMAMAPAANTAAKESASIAESRWNSTNASTDPMAAPNRAAAHSCNCRSSSQADSRPATTARIRAMGTTRVL